MPAASPDFHEVKRHTPALSLSPVCVDEGGLGVTSIRKRKHVWITAALAVLILGSAFVAYQYYEDPTAFSVRDDIAALHNMARIPGNAASIFCASYR